MTKTQILIFVAILCAAAIVAGVAMLAGAAWALVCGGALGLVGVVVLYDPDGKRAD